MSGLGVGVGPELADLADRQLKRQVSNRGALRSNRSNEYLNTCEFGKILIVETLAQVTQITRSLSAKTSDLDQTPLQNSGPRGGPSLRREAVIKQFSMDTLLTE